MRIAFFDAKPYDKNSFDYECKNNNIDITYFESKLNHDTVSLANGFDIVCVFVNDTVDSYVIDKLVKYGIKLIVLRCAGYNNVDVKYCFNKIHVMHVPSYSPYSIAEHAMAMLLTSIRRIHKAYNRTREFNFSLNGLTGYDLHSKTVGVIGTGRIGSIFINICKGFGMNVIAYDEYKKENVDYKYVSLDELFKESDVISLHCPLTSKTEHLINKNAIDKMKKGVMIVNTSRGKLINTEDLIEGIKERKIGGACLDVYEEEADIFYNDYSGHIMDDDTLSRLISLPNVIVTSHQAFLTNEALTNIAKTTIENVLNFYNGNLPSDNELCYKCGNIENCMRARNKKCF